MNKNDTITGRITIHNKGFAFIQQEDKDVYIPEGSTGFAISGDLVEASSSKDNKGRLEGKVLKVIERGKTEFVGNISKEGNSILFHADDVKIHTPFDLKKAPVHVGDKVVVKFETWTKPNTYPLASYVRTIGKKGEHETEMQSIIIKNGILYDFPPHVEEEARAIKAREKEIFESAEKDPNRRDIRDRLTFTIDPKSAKDFDDAISVRKESNGTLEIGIHIADVSHYVTPNSALDEEAQKRGFSTYLVDRTIPMLPEELSNDLCSLVPHTDRLSFSVILTMTKEGEVLKSWFGKTLIHSDRRFTYEDAQKNISSKSGDHADDLILLNTLAHTLRKERFKNGAIDFSDDEVIFELDEKGKPLAIVKKERLDTHKLVEEFMLLANKEVAKKIYELSEKTQNDHLFVYRVHDLPDKKRIDDLKVFVRALGHTFKPSDEVTPKEINDLLLQVKNTKEESLINTALIRSMAKAIYSTNNKGHFGLAFEYYSHFTSPIRRYPDLMVHRLLHAHLSNITLPSNELARYEQATLESSDKEKSIMDAERESIRYKQVEYMQNHVGEVFDGFISGVGEHGFYVEENNTKAQGMVSLRSLKDDYYSLNEKKYSIIGDKKGKTFTIGDEVRVKLLSADLEKRQLDFEIAS